MLTSVPTNLLTGFLGIGKTTAIRSILGRKPHYEKWTVVVNEFGEVEKSEHARLGRCWDERPCMFGSS